MVRGARTVRFSSENVRSLSPEATGQVAADPGDDLAAAREDGPVRRTPDAADPLADRAVQSGDTQPAPRRTSRRSLKNWRVRSRLVMLIITPTVAAVVLGGIGITSSVESAAAYHRVENLANLYDKVAGLVQAVQNEREDIVTYIVLGANGGRAAAAAPGQASTSATFELGVLKQDAHVTSGLAAQVDRQLRGIGSDYPALAQLDAEGAAAAISGLPALSAAAIQTNLPALVVIQKYDSTITALLALDNQVAVSSNDSTLADTVRVASLVSQIKEEASEQQAILTSGLSSSLVGLGQFGASQLSAIANAEAEQQGDLAEFDAAATPGQRQLYDNGVSGTTVATAQAEEQQAISDATGVKPIATDPTLADAVSGSSYVVHSLGNVEKQLVNSVISRSKALRDRAIADVIIVSIAVLLVLAVALILTTVVGRSLVRPLRKLRTGALEVAGISLPEAVRQMNETDGEGVSLEVEPIDVDSSDEIGEVARAFDQVHREALRLAANEAALRGNVNAMFVNLSRRSQSLVERQIGLIDHLEQGEQDSERLASLFQMDHLATRMRRNSENLLVLAGHAISRRWNQPVALIDVLRAAVSEIEQYERITLNVQPGIAVRGQAVNDVVHLLAELAENATSFSAAETPVAVTGHLLSSGGVLLDITDQGVGMGAEELAHANWQLDNPPVVDVAVSRRMGLFVVGRLAARHGVRVRLRPAASGGLTALVWLPDEVISHDGAGGGPTGLRAGDAQAAAIPGLAEIGTGNRNGEPVNGDRSFMEQEVNAARAPKFASLSDDQQDTGNLGRRVPGAGPRPGEAAAATSPLPVFRTSPRPALEQDREPPVAAEVGPAEVGPADASPDEQSDQPVVIPDETRADASRAPASGERPSFGSPLVAPNGGGNRKDGDQQPRRVTDLGWGNGDSGNQVVVPPAGPAGTENRLPIFEAVESDWFRRGRKGIAGWESPKPAETTTETPAWESPADEGWEAAQAVSSPSSAGVTTAGLPKRVPQANLVPGSAAVDTQPTPPARSAAATRERFASFQRGLREGRAATGADEQPDGEDQSS